MEKAHHDCCAIMVARVKYKEIWRGTAGPPKAKAKA